MTPPRVLIAGCGDVGNALGRLLLADGCTVYGLRRDVSGLAAGLVPVAADLAQPAAASLPAALDAVVYTAAADEGSDEAYRRAYVDGQRRLHDALSATGARPSRWIFVSSTGVYAQADGETVDVDSPAEAEPPLWTNRIHRDDCAGVLRHLLALPAPAPVYVGVDCEPAPQCEVMDWLAERLGVARPPRAAVGDGPARGSKRCSNARLLASGYRFLYPSFREGYAAVLAESAA